MFGGALGIRRTFILHAYGAKLPTDLLGHTSIRYDPDTTPAIVRQVNQKLRKAINAEGRISRLEGDWWQLSLTARTELEPSAISLLTIRRDHAGSLRITGRSWQEDGTLSARYWSEATKEGIDPPSIFYFWKANVHDTQTRPNSRGPARSNSRTSTEQTATSLRARTAPIASTLERPGSTFAPTQAT